MGEPNIPNGFVYIRLDSYLRKLRFTEARQQKSSRRKVPTVKELSVVAGIHPSSLSRISRGEVKSLNLEVLSAILSEMWRRGFRTKLTDILDFNPPSDLTSPKNSDDDPALQVVPPPLTRRQRLKYPGEEFVKAYAESESVQEEAA